MSYKIQVIDEYSFGDWFDYHLRFETEAEAEACTQRLPWCGPCGVLNLRVVRSDDPVNARWTEKGLRDKDGNLCDGRAETSRQGSP